jgi:hypothetical protein
VEVVVDVCVAVEVFVDVYVLVGVFVGVKVRVGPGFVGVLVEVGGKNMYVFVGAGVGLLTRVFVEKMGVADGTTVRLISEEPPGFKILTTTVAIFSGPGPGVRKVSRQAGGVRIPASTGSKTTVPFWLK